jgi:hypothetical protein
MLLEKILHSNFAMPDNDKLIVGNHSNDDAAVLDLGNGEALISTTDFFMPIVDDPFEFGRIASANAISDVYAMGENPYWLSRYWEWPSMYRLRNCRRVIEEAEAFVLKPEYHLREDIALIHPNQYLDSLLMVWFQLHLSNKIILQKRVISFSSPSASALEY